MKKSELYRGKAKSLFTSDDPNTLVCEFRNDTSAFDGVKTAKLNDKGYVNNYFNAFIMEHLEQANISTHFVKIMDETHSLVKHLKMFPIECVIRNVAAGSLCKRLGIEKNLKFSPALFEFFLKNDELHDPMICESHILTFNWATKEQLDKMQALSFAVNEVLVPLFDKAGLTLVDYKLEFGLSQDGEVILGDEFTPDGCRIWDKETGESLDKDRFRQDKGDVVESYQAAANRLGLDLTQRS